MQVVEYRKSIMSFLDKILKIDEEHSSRVSNEELYSSLFNRVKSSVMSSNPQIKYADLIQRTQKIYLKMCEYMNCGCLEDIYKPINKELLDYKSNTNISSKMSEA